jgi:hypothetical protein
MTIATEEAELHRHQIEEVRLLSLASEGDALRAKNARLRKLVAYLAGTNTDHVRVACAGNPIVCDAIHAEARAALGETQGATTAGPASLGCR